MVTDPTAQFYIRQLDLQPHPEGGYYKRSYCSSQSFHTDSSAGDQKERHLSSSIYFLLDQDNFSAFHRIKSDEIWHFYAGQPINIYEINKDGQLHHHILGSRLEKNQTFQITIPAGNWFGCRIESAGFALAGCTVTPAFDFEDFELAVREHLIIQYPQHEIIIRELTRI